LKKTARVRLIEERKRRQWSQQEVADLIGTTQHNVSRWEGGVTTPAPYFRAKLCELFCMRPQELGLLIEQMVEEPHPTPTTPMLTAPNTSLLTQDQHIPLWNIPYPRNPFFTGREHLLSSLHEMLQQQDCATASPNRMPYMAWEELAKRKLPLSMSISVNYGCQPCKIAA